MSTIDEHLATMEMYKANGNDGSFNGEAYMLLQVHWRELIAERDASSIQEARAEIEQRLREQHGEKADTYIARWRAALAEKEPS